MNGEATSRDRNLYEEHDGLLFVPVIRERLVFAVIVQRVVQELDLGAGDILAVEMPERVGQQMKPAWEDPDALLQVRLIMTREEDDQLKGLAPREVFAITPTDAVVEAVRLARKKRIRLACIDAELQPSTLSHRDCTYFDDFPDDTWALDQGVNWYFEKALPFLLENRVEAVDSRREAHMARRLRELMTQAPDSRIVVVCSAVHIQGIKHHLAAGQPLALETDKKASHVAMAPQMANPLAARQYLDDFPAVTEAYELARQEGGAPNFDKARETRQAIMRVLSSGVGAPASTREVLRLMEVLDRSLSGAGRLTPRFQELEQCVTQCFDNPSAVRSRLEAGLMAYGERVSADTIARPGQRAPIGHDAKHVFRTCGLQSSSFAAGPVDPVPAADREKAWPPWKAHHNEMRRQAFQVISFRQRTRAEAFRGSLENGIHIRRTIRGLQEHPQQLYVRKGLPTREVVDRNDPVVWLFSDAPDGLSSGHVWFGLCGRPDLQFIGAEFVQLEFDHPVKSVPAITRRPLAGMLSYGVLGVELEDVRRVLGAGLGRRVPQSLSAEEDKQRDAAEVGLPWWHKFANRAAQCAEACVYRVALPDFPHAAAFDEAVRKAGKRVAAVPAAAFDIAQLRKLQRMVWATRPYTPPRGSDTNLASYERDVVHTYKSHLATDPNADDWLS
jgi:hypothetical protein